VKVDDVTSDIFVPRVTEKVQLGLIRRPRALSAWRCLFSVPAPIFRNGTDLRPTRVVYAACGRTRAL